MKRPIWLIMPGVLGASACAFWHTDPQALQRPIPAHRAVQVWSGGTSYDLHHVTVQDDTVRGSTNWTTFDCDTCVVAIAMSAVDSVKVKKTNIAVTILASFAALLPLAYWGAIAALGGPRS